MPATQGRKRRAEPEEPGSPDGSPGPETQRRRTLNNASDDEDFADGAGAATQSGSINEMAKKLVRLALALEFQRKPLRRGDISEKVLGPNGRQFKSVFSEAQRQLREVFGMEMVELPAKEKVTLQQRRAAQKSTSQAKGTTSWILTSILPGSFQDPAILQPSAAPTAAEESKYTAIYTVLVSLIRLSGGALPDAKMERSLQRLRMDDNTPVTDYEKTEKLMKRLEKDGYIVRIKESTGTGEDDVYWTVGPRGKVEVGDDGVRGLTKAVFGDQNGIADAELERKLDRSLGISERAERAEREQPAERPKKAARKKRNQEQEQEQEDEDEDEDEEVESG